MNIENNGPPPWVLELAASFGIIWVPGKRSWASPHNIPGDEAIRLYRLLDKAMADELDKLVADKFEKAKAAILDEAKAEAKTTSAGLDT